MTGTMKRSGEPGTDGAAATETATFAGGCFWCIEPVFDELDGVQSVVSGYTGGHVADPSYAAVCDGTTGHAEAVQIVFDPRRVSFKDLLEVFFSVHDPTTLNRQGADVGTQYRSGVFFHTPEQEATARQTIAELQAQGLWDKPIVTEVTPFEVFYPAEDYHQRYFEKHPYQPYCLLIIRPKVAKFRKAHLSRLKQKSASG